MAETLVVITILVIVAAVAVPNVAGLRSGLDAMELNARAQQVYQAVQYNLSSLQASGRTGDLAKDASADPGAVDLSDAYNSQSVFTADGHSTALVYRLYALPGAAAAAQDYLLTQEGNAVTKALSGGTCWIEFSPSTGEVYSVFYTESADAPSYAEMSAMRADADGLAKAGVGYFGGEAISPAPAKAEADPDDDDSDNVWRDLRLSLVNGEEFYARITGSAFADPDIFNKIELRVTVSGRSIDPYNAGYSTWKRTFSSSAAGAGRIEYVDGTDEIDVILDSMRDGLSFCDLFPQLMPGTNVNISVVLYYEGEYVSHISETSRSVFYESLEMLGDQQENDRGTGILKVAKVKNVRQLRNLDLAYRFERAGIDSTLAGDIIYNYISIVAVQIVGDIDFDGTAWNPTTVSIQSRNASADGNLNPLESFKPIVLPSSFNGMYGYTGDRYVIDGKDGDEQYTLRNFVISYPGDAQDNCGLFAENGTTLRNITMENPKVTGANYTGALVGHHTSGLIINCHVTGTGTDSLVSGGDYVGGLVGKLDGWITGSGCSASVNVSGAHYVGGLAGWLEAPATDFTAGDAEGLFECSVTGTGDHVGGVAGAIEGSGSVSDFTSLVNSVSGRDCVGGLAGSSTKSLTACAARGYASDNRLCMKTTVSGRSSVGGLVGQLLQPNGALTGCYSSCDVDSANGTGAGHGGLVGSHEAGSISNCYSSGTVSGSAQVGGLVGRRADGGGAISSCYSTSTVLATSQAGGFIGRDESSSERSNTRALGRMVAQNGADMGSVGGYVGSQSTSPNSSGSSYLRGLTYNNLSATESFQPSARTYSELTSSPANAVSLENSHPVTSDLLSYAFPYGGVSYDGAALPHFGDWHRE